MLKKINLQHAIYPDWSPACTFRSRVVELYNSTEIFPWNNLLYRIKTLFFTCFLAVLLKTTTFQALLFHFYRRRGSFSIISGDKVRLTQSELDELRQDNAVNENVIGQLETTQQLMRAAVGRLSGNTQKDMLKFFETGSSPMTSERINKNNDSEVLSIIK